MNIDVMIDLVLQVILIPTFSHLIETQSLKALLKLVDASLGQLRMPLPKELVMVINNRFNTMLMPIKEEVHVMMSSLDPNEIPQLRNIDPTFEDIIVGPSPMCLVALFYNNKLNEKLTSNLLSMCDKCMKGLQILCCQVITFPSGSGLKQHRLQYCGVMTYLLCLQGSKLSHFKMGNKAYTCTSGASAIYDPTLSTEVYNQGPTPVQFLQIQFYRPFASHFDAVNRSVLHIMSESFDVKHACQMSTLQDEEKEST